MKQSRQGAPRKYSIETLENALALCESGMTQQEAADWSQIPRSSISHYKMQKQNGLLKEWDEEELKRIKAEKGQLKV